MKARPTIFLSGVSHEFGAFRDAVENEVEMKDESGRMKGGEYPWTSPQADLAAARKLIEQCGYWRRKEELEDAEEAAKGWA